MQQVQRNVGDRQNKRRSGVGGKKKRSWSRFDSKNKRDMTVSVEEKKHARG
jgi:hypothetical protein